MRSPFWILACLVAISCVASAILWRDLHAERVQAASLRLELAAAKGREQEALASARRAIPDPLPMPPATSPVAQEQPKESVAQAAPATRPPDAQSILQSTVAQQSELMKDPEYRKARLVQIRASMPANYPGLAEDMHLSSAQEEKMYDLLADYQLKSTEDISLLLANQNDQAAIQDLQRRQQELSRQRDDAIAALLGPAAVPQWEQYQLEAPGRLRARSMNTTLTQAGMPLSEGQLKSLAAAVSTESRRLNQEVQDLARSVDAQDPVARASIQGDLVKRQQEGNQRILAAAAQYLNEEQLSIIRAQFQQQDALTRAVLRAQERVSAAQAQQ